MTDNPLTQHHQHCLGSMLDQQLSEDNKDNLETGTVPETSQYVVTTEQGGLFDLSLTTIGVPSSTLLFLLYSTRGAQGN